jgi:thioredoxin 2
LFTGKPVELKSANFDTHVTRNDLPVIVDFWAPWCGPCRMMAPYFDAAAKRFSGRVRLAKVNSDDEPALSTRFGIRGIPTLIALRNGKEVARQSGAMGAPTLDRWIGNTIA